MALYLVTGQPGHGKTAYALVRAKEFKDEGREVYAHGVKDLDHDSIGFKHLQDPTKWQDLPDGSVILMDECYTHFPNRNPGAKVPEHVEALARHRHRGFDFIFVAQQGLQLDPFMRGLYEQHVHVRQTSVIKSKTKLKRWTVYQSNTNGPSNDVVDWVRPKWVFDHYTSTTMVTTKRSVPMWMRWVLAGLVFVALIVLGLKWHYESKIEGYNAQRSNTTTEEPTAGRRALERRTDGGSGQRTYNTAAEYATDHLPRFATMPWTAPVYDARAVVAEPELYCMATEPGYNASGDWRDGGCSCMTEQGTRYDLGDGECRRVARYGTPYNPYKRPSAPAAAPQGYGEPPAPQYVSTAPTGRAEPPVFLGGSVGTVGAPGVAPEFGRITRSQP